MRIAKRRVGDQQWLLLENPAGERFGPEFLQALPRAVGKRGSELADSSSVAAVVPLRGADASLAVAPNCSGTAGLRRAAWRSFTSGLPLTIVSRQERQQLGRTVAALREIEQFRRFVDEARLCSRRP